jgi:hypothetical protein
LAAPSAAGYRNIEAERAQEKNKHMRAKAIITFS